MAQLEYENKCLAMVKESLKPKEMGMKILSDDAVVYYSKKTDFTRGGVGITVRTFKDECFANISHKVIDENINDLLQAQLNSARNEVISELQGILDDNVSDQDKLNQVARFVERLKEE